MAPNTCRIVQGHLLGAEFAHDPDEIAEHCAFCDHALVLGVERCEHEIFSIVLQELDRDFVLEGSEEDHVADSGNVGFLENAKVVRLQQRHHAVAGDSAGESAFGVAHFGGDKFECVAVERICPADGVAGGDEAEVRNWNLELACRDGGWAYFIGETQRPELHHQVCVRGAESYFEVGVARPLDAELVCHFLLCESVALSEFAEFRRADPIHA